AAGQVATVAYVTSDISATGSLDYSGVAGSIQFTSASQTATVSIPILDDKLIEGNETFQFKLSNASGATLGSPDTATITIVDDDDFSDSNQAIVEFGTPAFDVIEDVGQVALTVTRTGNTSSQVTVPWSTADGTAIAPGDYTAVVGGSVTFAAGETAKNINVT